MGRDWLGVELADLGRVHAALEVVGGVGSLDDGIGGGEAVVGFGGVDRFGGLLGAVVSVDGEAVVGPAVDVFEFGQQAVVEGVLVGDGLERPEGRGALNQEMV